MKKFKTRNWLKIGAYTLAGAALCGTLAYYNFIYEQASDLGNAGAGGDTAGVMRLDTLYKIENGQFAVDTENTFSLDDCLGDVVVLNFWAVWCQPCKVEIPYFNRLYEEYKDEGLEVVVVSTDVSMSAQQLLDAELNNSKDKDYQQYYNSWNTFTCKFGKYDKDNDVLKLYDSSGSLPVTVVIDRTGKVVKVVADSMTYEELEETVLSVLREETESE